MLSLTRWSWFVPLGIAAWIVGEFAASYVPAAWLLRPLLVGTLAGLVLVPVVSPLTRRIAGPLNVVAVLALGVGVVMAAPRLIPPAVASTDPIHVPGRDGPDIYIVLLDAYARQDTLAEYGYDNEPFLRALERRGFDVDRKAHGHYLLTTQTLAAMMQMRHPAELALSPSSEVEQRRVIHDLIDQGPALGAFRSAGYEVVYSAGNAAEAALLSADAYLDSGGPNEFELHLLGTARIPYILDVLAPTLLYDSHRDRVLGNLRDLHELAVPESDPRLVIAHVLAPHAPFVFAYDRPPECYPERCTYFQPEPGDTRGYIRQIDRLNTHVLAAVDAIVDANPEAVIVLFGDHGSRIDADHDEWYRVLWAARTPGRPGLLAEGTPVNLFGSLLSAYLGADWQPAPDQCYESGGEGVLVLWERSCPR